MNNAKMKTRRTISFRPEVVKEIENIRAKTRPIPSYSKVVNDLCCKAIVDERRKKLGLSPLPTKTLEEIQPKRRKK